MNKTTNELVLFCLVEYHSNQKNMDTPIALKPLESLRYVIPERDQSGGSGANLIIEWRSDKFVNPPIVESIMIGTQSTQGISFTSRGQEIFTSEY